MYQGASATIDYKGIYKHRYMLTIAKHQVKDYVTKEDLMAIYRELSFKIPHMHLISMIYEISPTYRQLHAHALVYTKKAVYYRRHSSNGGFRLQWSPVFDEAGVNDYLQKDLKTRSQDEILMENECNHKYLFRDRGARSAESL